MKSIKMFWWIVVFWGTFMFHRETVGLTCYDCIEPCDEDYPQMCGGLYCARLMALNETLQYTILHTCLNSVHLIDNVTLEINSCAALDDLDPLWPETISIDTKTGMNLTDFSHGVLNICDESDTFCNETKCDFDVYEIKPQNSAIALRVNCLNFVAIFLYFLITFLLI
jgi:hypothetical protein